MINIFNCLQKNCIEMNETDFHSTVMDSLSFLLEFSCQVSKDMLTKFTDGCLFEYGDCLSSKHRLVYFFSYNGERCYVDILPADARNYFDKNTACKKANYYSNTPLESQRLLVSFNFHTSITETIPVQTKKIVISTDEYMQFLSAKFERRFNFNLDLRISTLMMRKVMNELRDVKSFLLYFDRNKKTVIFDSKLYFNDDMHFETSFFKMMHFFESNPVLFASAFPDYPTLNDFALNGIEKCRDFFDKFSSDYTKDAAYLNNGLLLFDMADI